MNIGKKLKFAREAIGYKLEDLSSKTGIGVSTISDYENDNREPKVSQLSKLAEALKRPLEFFLNDEMPSPPIMLWRDCPALEQKNETQAEFEQLCRQYDNLEIWTNEKQMPQLPFLTGIDSQNFAYNNAKALALSVHRELGLGNIPSASLKKILEERFVKIFYLDFTGSAISMVSDIYGAAILLNKSHKPWRRSFDLAHELFHILTWKIFRKNLNDFEPSQKEEKFADVFASCLLLPEEPLYSRISSMNNLTFNDLEDIAREFDVSFEALLWRIKYLYNINEDEIRKAIDDSKRILERRKVLESTKPKPFPERYMDLAQRALNDGRMSLMQFAKYTGLKYKEAECYLTEGEFADEEISISIA